MQSTTILVNNYIIDSQDFVIISLSSFYHPLDEIISISSHSTCETATKCTTMICSSDFKYTSSKYKVYFECTTMLTSITFLGIQENNLIIFYIDVGLRVVHATDCGIMLCGIMLCSIILNMPLWNDHSLWI